MYLRLEICVSMRSTFHLIRPLAFEICVSMIEHRERVILLFVTRVLFRAIVVRVVWNVRFVCSLCLYAIASFLQDKSVVFF